MQVTGFVLESTMVQGQVANMAKGGEVGKGRIDGVTAYLLLKRRNWHTGLSPAWPCKRDLPPNCYSLDHQCHLKAHMMKIRPMALPVESGRTFRRGRKLDPNDLRGH
jgi:hypothetical protein